MILLLLGGNHQLVMWRLEAALLVSNPKYITNLLKQLLYSTTGCQSHGAGGHTTCVLVLLVIAAIVGGVIGGVIYIDENIGYNITTTTSIPVF